MPAPEPFTVHVERSGPLIRLTPYGELDLATVAILERAFEVAYRSDAAAIEVDLHQLAFLDSSGIHLLIRMDCACLGEQRLRIITGTPLVDRVLAIAGVRDHLPITTPRRPPDNRILVRFEYESHDPDGQWSRGHGVGLG
jgi:anti-sigma B factor antagonist